MPNYKLYLLLFKPDYSLMTYGKIKELLKKEYSEFNNDIVVIESPFLETTRSGLPIRNVYLGKSISY